MIDLVLAAEKGIPPLDVSGVDVELTTSEIVDIVREMRGAGYGNPPKASVPSFPQR